MGATRRIAEFAANLRLKDVPEDVWVVAKGGFLDATTASIAGAHSEPASILTRCTRAWGGAPTSGVIGEAFKTSPVAAARINGTIQSSHDFDPPVPLFPVLLAVGEAQQSTGREVLEAYVAGYEVQSKLQGGTSAKHSTLGWHSNTVFGTFAAAVAASKLLKLDAPSTLNALGVASSQAAGTMQSLGTMAKPLQTGLAAANGIIAASLAKEGLTATGEGLEGRAGTLKLVGGRGEYDEKAISQTFGAPWNLLERQIRIKPYPCCRWAHRPLDALLAVIRSHAMRGDEVERIECEISAHVPEVMTYGFPKDGNEAKFSLSYCLAVAVADGEVGLDQFAESRIKSEDVAQLMHRVDILHPNGKSELDTGTMLPCTIRLHLRDGTVLEEEAGIARGDPGNAMTLDDVQAKFLQVTRSLIASKHAERILTIIRHLEDAPDLQELAGILTFNLKQADDTRMPTGRCAN